MAKSREFRKKGEDIRSLKSKLTETEKKLRAKEEENVKLEVSMGKLHFYLETSDSVRIKLMEDVKKLRAELEESKKALEEKDNLLTSMEKEYLHAYGDLRAESMARKQLVTKLTEDKLVLERELRKVKEGPKKVTLELVQGGIIQLKQAVFKLEKIVEGTTNESLGLEEEVEGNNSKEAENNIKRGRKRIRSTTQTRTSSQVSMDSVPEPQQLGKRLTRALSSAKVATQSESKTIKMGRIERKRHGDRVEKKVLARKISKPNLPAVTGGKDTSSNKEKEGHGMIKLGPGRKSGQVDRKCCKEFSSNYPRQKHVNGGKIFRCTLCAVEFYTHFRLKQHMQDFHGDEGYNAYGCSWCGKVFETENLLKNHRAGGDGK